jgi:hypothetical protein
VRPLVFALAVIPDHDQLLLFREQVGGVLCKTAASLTDKPLDAIYNFRLKLTINCFL